MRSFSWHRRLLPLTMTVMALLFAEKAVSLAGEVSAQQSAATASSRSAADATAKTPDQALNGAAMIASTAPGMPAKPSVTAVPSAAPVSPVELQLLQDLRRRRQILDERAKELDQRTDLVQAAEQKLRVRLDELTALQGQLESIEAARKQRQAASWDGLVKTYEAMKPRDAASIFNMLDINVLLEVLDRMNDRKAAPVLAAMLPERARLVTQMLAQKRTLADALMPHPDLAAAGPAVGQSK